MLGTRGCRLGIVHPEIYEMQVEAIMRAARAAASPPRLEIMIPLVDFEAELVELRAMINRMGERYDLRDGEDYIVGTMIELPRACFIADRLAAEAAFFSFGTNDLTQTALGFSRDDVEAGFVPAYLERRILDRSPFETVDVDGVGALVATAVRLGREQRAGIELGVCGEHGGDPDSIAFFEEVGSTTCPARPSGSRSRAWLRRKRCCDEHRDRRARLASAGRVRSRAAGRCGGRRARGRATRPAVAGRAADLERQLDAQGGGVAEMLGPLLAYARGSGVDARWAVVPATGRSSRSPSASTTGCTGCRGTAGRSAPPSARPTRRRSRPMPGTCSR